MFAARSYYEYKPAAHLLITDEDAADFLQSQFTNDLRPFAAGQCTYGLWLNVKGKVLADSVLLCEGQERFRLLSERCEGNLIASHMERHIIADDVVIESLEPGFGFELSAVEHTDLEACLGELELGLPERGQSFSSEWGVIYSRHACLYNIVIHSAEAASAFRNRLQAVDWTALSGDARGLARIDAGIVQVPEEIGPDDLPGEGGMESEAISFTKGCYLGQEVVARMHNIGKPQRGLFVVEGDWAGLSLPAPLYNSENKAVGELRTAYALVDRSIGVAILKTRFAQPGDHLRMETNEVTVLSALRKGHGHD